ncbi:DUF11 domain-containing protein [Streptomyces sp. NPDC051907]|uniref:DUF11 domain-containing protein n=1 Tax=Streptomyces sp. NPDC051907 TaxID=3155284 RepID=UPI003436264E
MTTATAALTAAAVPHEAAAEASAPFEKRLEERLETRLETRLDERFEKRFEAALYGDFATIGNTVMVCPDSPADEAARCALAADGLGGDDNDAFDMRRTDTAGMTEGFGSSTGKVTVPPGAEIVYARLFWGGNAGAHRAADGTERMRCDNGGGGTGGVGGTGGAGGAGADAVPSPGRPLDAVPAIGVAGGVPVKVSPKNLVRDPATTSGAHYYTGEADVTAAFDGLTGSGAAIPVAVGDLWAANGRGCVAGWSLTVVYGYDGPDETYAPERRRVYVYGGHALQRPGAPATTVAVDGFRRTGDSAVRASVTALEGDWNAPGDRFRVHGREIADDRADGAANFFAGASDGAVDPQYVDNLGVDARAFALPAATIPPGETSTTLSLATEDDSYLSTALALSVPVADLEVTKTASATTVAPGDTVTYTITAENVSGRDYPNARFGDDLTDNLDDAVYNLDARATVGTVSYEVPRIRFVGDIPAGRSATLTYTVTVDDPVTGDGRLGNSVAVDSPRSNCGQDSGDPRCGATPLLAPSPSPSPSPSPTRTIQLRPAPAPPTPTDAPTLAHTGTKAERLWLLGGVALSLTAAGVVAVAASRGRRQ